MPVFKDASELCHFVGGIFEEMLRDADLREGFGKLGVVLKLSFKKPDAVLLVDMVNGEVLCEDDGRPSTVQISTSGDVGHHFWLGKVNIGLALAKGEMRAKGPIQKIIALVPLAKRVFPRYREMLVRAGREDLTTV